MPITIPNKLALIFHCYLHLFYHTNQQPTTNKFINTPTFQQCVNKLYILYVLQQVIN